MSGLFAWLRAWRRRRDMEAPFPAAWARVLGAEYEALRDEVARRHRTVMDAYGATYPAEFFAVAAETFFEKPEALARKHPELYEQLRAFYGQDPATHASS